MSAAGLRSGDIEQSLRFHLDALESAGRLLRIDSAADVDESISALSHQAYLQRAQACLFTNVAGFPGWRVASQLVMDRGMWALALGVPEAEVVSAFARRLREPIAAELVSGGPVQEVVETGEAVDLMRIPAMWTSERDPGRYIASGMCIIKNPETGIRNMSVHRAQVLGRDTTGYYMLPRQAMRIYQMHRQLGRPMQAAMVIGGHPLLMFAAAFVAPFGMDELAVAGGLMRRPVRLVKCRTIDIEVPADAELVLEGEILPEDAAPEGPFGEVTGTYSKKGTAPVFRVKAVTRRAAPVFYAMSCGMAPSDAHSITCAVVESKLSDHLKGVEGGLLDIRDVRCVGGMSPLLVALRMKPRHAGQARTALLAAAASPYLHPKFLVGVDEDIDVGDPWRVLWALATRLDASSGLARIDRTRVFTLDNASPLDPGVNAMHRTGTKALFDATLDPRIGAAARERHSPSPAFAAGEGAARPAWSAALGLPEEGFVLALRDRLERRVAPAIVSAGKPRIVGPAQPAEAPLTGVLVIAGELCLVRGFADGEHFRLALDTPRLAMLLGQARQATLALLTEPAVTLAAAIGTLGMRADLDLAGSLAGRPIEAHERSGQLVPAYSLLTMTGTIDPTAVLRIDSAPGFSGIAGVTLDAVRFVVIERFAGAQERPVAPPDPRGVANRQNLSSGAMAIANEALTAHHLKSIEGGLDLLDVHCPPQAGGMLVVVKLAPRVAGQAKTALLAALSGPCTLARVALAIDADVSATDPCELIWAMANRTHAQDDIAVIAGASCLPQDALAEPGGHGAARTAKWICDATVPLGRALDDAESFARAVPKNHDKVRLADFLR